MVMAESLRSGGEGAERLAHWSYNNVKNRKYYYKITAQVYIRDNNNEYRKFHGPAQRYLYGIHPTVKRLMLTTRPYLCSRTLSQHAAGSHQLLLLAPLGVLFHHSQHVFVRGICV